MVVGADPKAKPPGWEGWEAAPKEGVGAVGAGVLPNANAGAGAGAGGAIPNVAGAGCNDAEFCTEPKAGARVGPDPNDGAGVAAVSNLGKVFPVDEDDPNVGAPPN